MRHIAIITSGFLPVPDVLGGAVEALEMNYITENEKDPAFRFSVFSIWDERAEQEATSYRNTHFEYVRPGRLIRTLDRFVYATLSRLRGGRVTTRHRYMLQRAYYIIKVAWRLSRQELDGVLIEDNPLLFWCLRFFGNENRYREKVYYHLHREFTRDFGCARQISRVHKVIGVSQFVVESLNAFLVQRIGRPLDDRQKAVLVNCTDVNVFNPKNVSILSRAAELKQSLGIPRNQFVVLYSGRLTQEKGVEELVSAFIMAAIPHATLVLTGAHFYDLKLKSPFEERLVDLISSSGASIKLTGYVSHSDMPALYLMADVCCAPSLCEDAAPLAVVEALASGRPVVATYSGGIPEYVDNQCAMLIKRDNHLVANLADAILGLYENPEFRKGMAAHAREIAKDRTPKRFFEELVVLLEANVSNYSAEKMDLR